MAAMKRFLRRTVRLGGSDVNTARDTVPIFVAGSGDCLRSFGFVVALFVCCVCVDVVVCYCVYARKVCMRAYVYGVYVLLRERCALLVFVVVFVLVSVQAGVAQHHS